MKRKDERTMEKYMKAGAEMRLFKTLGTRVFADVGNLIKASDRQKLTRALSIIDEICSNAENNMFRDHPQLTHEYTKVFYGATDNPPTNQVDEQILRLAKETSDAITSEGV